MRAGRPVRRRAHRGWFAELTPRRRVSGPGANAAGGEAPPPLARFGLASFTIATFRFQWSADVLSAWALEMETLILGWYVLVETDSALLLSVFAALRFVGTLIAPVFGVLADRLPRQRILVATRVAYAGAALALMGLGLAAWIEPWHVFVLGSVAGLLRPCEMVLRQSLIADTVPAPLLMNALGLSRTTTDSARIVGTLIGAALLSSLGIGGAYVVVSAFYLASIVLSLRITAPRPVAAAGAARPLAELVVGFRYIRNSPAILTVMVLAVLANFTAFPLTQGLLPAVARGVYGLDENGLAWMVAAAAAGALGGSVLLAVVVRGARPGRLMLAGLVVWHLLVLLFAHAGGLATALGLLVLIGLAISTSMIPMSVVLMRETAGEYRGRVMGVRQLAVYALPLGLLAGGALIEWIGVRAALTATSLLGLGLAVAAAVWWGRVRPRSEE